MGGKLYNPKASLLGFEKVAKKTIDFTLAAWNTVATHEVFTVTGLVRCLTIYQVTGSLTSGGAATVSFGIEGAANAYAAAQAYTNLAAGQLVQAGGSAAASLQSFTNFFAAQWADIFTIGKDLGYEVATAALTGGTIVAYCFWTPISDGSLVVGGAGGVL